MRIPFTVVFTLILAFHIALAADTPTDTAAAKPIRILFIGNSLTMNNNLPYQLTTIAAGATPALKIETATVATGGYSLEKHWETGKALKKIQEGNWDFVVLQEHSYSSLPDPKRKVDPDKPFNPEEYNESTKVYARKFDAEIKKINAKCLLYMSWALQKTPDDQAGIENLFNELGKELGATVVPVGAARINAVKADTSLTFFVKDGKHPTQAGTYLAACTFLRAITGKFPKTTVLRIADPKDAKKTLVDVTPEHAAYLQKIADETVQARN